MLTPLEKRNTAKELQENFKRLHEDLETVLADLRLSESELRQVLTMKHPDPSHVWMVRDYLEDKLNERGIEMYPFTKLADHSANKWFSYDTPWRKNTP